MIDSCKCVPRILSVLGAFLIALFIFFTFNNNTLTIKAVTQSDVVNVSKSGKFGDGITDWTPQYNGSNKIASIPISDGVSLDYTFGSARDSSGKVKNGDNTFLTDVPSMSTTPSGAGYNYYSKINVFINDHGNYYSIVHQGKNSYIGGNPERASDTSMDFALVTGQGNSFYNSYSVMMKMENKVFFTGHDKDGRTVLKIAGYLQNYNIYAEVVLRPSITGSPIVQRELYLYNDTGSPKQFQTYFGEDTSLTANSSSYDNGSDTGDDVPLYAIGGGQGLYINNKQNGPTSESKLFVTNNVTDGFKDYMGIAFSNPYSWNVKGKANVSTAGDMVKPSLDYNQKDTGDTANKAGSLLLFGYNASGNIFPILDRDGKQNSAYTLRWTPTNLDSGATAHYASTLGATLSPYAVPVVKKTYTNSNQDANGMNHVGDTLHFKLKVNNDGLNSNWTYRKLVDKMPTGLQIDQSSVKYSSTYMTTSGTGSGMVDTEHAGPEGSVPAASTTNNQINFTPNTSLKDKATYTVSFDAKVTYAAIDNLTNGKLTNTATFTGNNTKADGTNIDSNRNYVDSVDVPVKVPNFQFSFTKQLRNETTNPNGLFTNTADAKPGNTIDYRAIFTGTGNDTIKSTVFSDTLPAGLKLVSGSVKVNGVAQPDTLNLYLGAYAKNTPITVDFKATVTSIQTETISNIATMNNLKTSGSETYNGLISNSADLNVTEDKPTVSFVKVPDTIDFGSINSNGSERILSNVRTNGRLVVNHSKDSAYQVTVGYDNDSDGAIKNGDNKLIQNNDNALYFDQNDGTTKENWSPISPSGIPIKRSGFSGSNDNLDLTDYIGTHKWKLRVPANTKSGLYNGKVTWSIIDSLQK